MSCINSSLSKGCLTESRGCSVTDDLVCEITKCNSDSTLTNNANSRLYMKQWILKFIRIILFNLDPQQGNKICEDESTWSQSNCRILIEFHHRWSVFIRTTMYINHYSHFKINQAWTSFVDFCGSLHMIKFQVVQVFGSKFQGVPMYGMQRSTYRHLKEI